MPKPSFALADPFSSCTTEFDLNNQFNLISGKTYIEAHQFRSYEKINDEPTQVEVKKEVTAWSLKGNILAGLAVVAAVTVVAAYAASVVFTAGATAAAAPFIVGGLTSIVGTAYVVNQAESDIENQEKSSAWTYMWEGFKGACQGADYGFTVCSVLSLGEAALTCLKGISISGTPGLALADGGALGGGIAISLEIDAEFVGALVLEGVAGLGLSIVLAKVPKLGGAYRDTKGRGGEGHHCPSSQSSDLPKNDGPSIHMEREDHKNTKSWGPSKSAKEYRAKQAELIKEGKFKEAQQMDIDDVLEKYGNKYKQNIQEMIEYTEELFKRLGR